MSNVPNLMLKTNPFGFTSGNGVLLFTKMNTKDQQSQLNTHGSIFCGRTSLIPGFFKICVATNTPVPMAISRFLQATHYFM